MTTNLAYTAAGLIPIGIILAVHALRRASDTPFFANCRCGYPVKGIASDRCPECGVSRQVSFADLMRRRRVGLAISWILAVILIGFGSFLGLSAAFPPTWVSDETMTLRARGTTVSVEWRTTFARRGPVVEKVTVWSTPGPAEQILVTAAMMNQGAASSDSDQVMVALRSMLEAAPNMVPADRDQVAKDLHAIVGQALRAMKVPLPPSGLLYESSGTASIGSQIPGPSLWPVPVVSFGVGIIGMLWISSRDGRRLLKG